MNSTLSKNNLNYDIEFISIIEDFINNETVLQMKNYRQHYNTSTYDHCLNVAYLNYKICKKLKLDYISATRAGMIHDLFLYDWRKNCRTVEIDGLHAFVHPKIALKNASNLFDLNDKEKDIILKHMWPVTLAFPKYKESFIITLTDKYSAIQEALDFYYPLLIKHKFYKYAYVLLCMLILF
jgi:uncharacterized protein